MGFTMLIMMDNGCFHGDVNDGEMDHIPRVITACAFTVGERDMEHLCKDTGADLAEAKKQKQISL
jgi:hypothetical protein